MQKRALESGVLLPDHPTWMDKPEVADLRPSMEERMERMKALRNMNSEERDAYRLERYQAMRERAAEVGLDLPEKPPWKDRPARPELNQDDEWARQQAVIDGMTPEERAACHAMHRRHMRQMGPGRGMMQHPQMPAMPGRGFGPGRMMGPGAGYGPQGDFWDPSR
ncbi:MAG: cell division protein [gamma proteobacterium endosymbiont of Lamellibrachia anaximandri]|nr:cell division protein [gamma proteobacterium endosymbiont of Lamellibrachia anaximandri]MBL3532627.1 cell division protein [gamma proteobacterium endosymbiont of Lamellibrachia anaximandri]MBL3599050.1 cell division protein [gamma proteobacterium endosymbiont of Lamellibrachia anaximandri]